MVLTYLPWLEWESSNQQGERILLTGHENEMVPQVGPENCNNQEKRTSVETLRKSQYLHTRYVMRDTVRIPKPPSKTHLLHKPDYHFRRVDSVYLDNANELRETGLAYSIYPTMGEWWKDKDKNVPWKGKWRYYQQKEKKKYIFLCCVLTIFLNLYPQGD